MNKDKVIDKIFNILDVEENSIHPAQWGLINKLLSTALEEAEKRGRQQVLDEFEEEQKKLLQGFKYKKPNLSNIDITRIAFPKTVFERKVKELEALFHSSLLEKLEKNQDIMISLNLFAMAIEIEGYKPELLEKFTKRIKDDIKETI